MRIAHLVTHTGLNGVATSCRTLINAQLRHGHEIILVTRPRAWLARQDFERPLDRFETHMKTRIGEIRRVGHMLRAWKPTVVHCHGSKANKYGMAFRLAAAGPVVTTAHSRNIQLPPMFFRAMIAPSEQTADFHNRKNWVRRSKISVIPHLFEPIHVDRSRAVERLAEFGITADDRVIGVVGSIDARKNQIDAFHILKRVLEHMPDAKLVLIGGASDITRTDQWGTWINDPAIKDRLVLTGHQNDASHLIAGFDVLLCTSKIEEGPIVVLEAMAQSVPVVSSAVGMVPTLIRDGIDGYVFNIGDVEKAAQNCQTLLGDKDQHATLGAQGNRRLHEICDETKILAQIDKVYETVARAARAIPLHSES